jgi:hypothetical protein
MPRKVNVRKVVKDAATRYAGAFLPGWEVRVVISKDKHPEDTDEFIFKAEAVATWAYMRLLVLVYLPNVEGETKEDLDRIILHEILHGVLDEMSEAKET